MSDSVIIIGGGYGGLATAALLAKSGYDVTVVEKNDQLGGRAGQLKQDGFRFDTGPSWYLMPEVFEAFYDLFEKDVQQELSLTRLTPGYKVFFESQPSITIQGDLEKDAATFERIEAGAGAALKKYVDKSTKLYDLSLQHFLYSNFSKKTELLDASILKALPKFGSAALTSLDSYVSRFFKDSRIKRMLEYHSVFLGGSPYEIPAIYSLMSTLDFKSGVYFPKNGMYSLVESLVSLGSELGVKYRTDSSVEKIIVKNGTAAGVKLQDGSTVQASIVISNADLYHTETKLLDAAHQTYPEEYWQKKQPGPSALLVSLGVKGSIDTLEHHNLYFVDKWKENFDSIYSHKEIPEYASIYICNPNKTDPTAAPKNHENIFILVPLPAAKKLTTKETASLIEKTIELVASLSDTPDLKTRIVTRDIVDPSTFAERFNAWDFNALGGQSHLLSQSAFFRTPNVSRRVKNLYYVGAGTTPGIGLPMCLISAQLVYKRIVGIKSNGPIRTLPKEEA